MIRIKKIIFFICLIGFITMLIATIYPYFKYKQEDNEYKDLATKKEEINTNNNTNIDDVTNLVLEYYQKLHEINNDMIGWIKIEGTVIDYPVMHKPNNEDYYLSHTFYKKYSLSGTPFASKNYKTNNNNILIYAHNTNNQTLFGQLLKYKDKSFYDKYQYINFDTLEETSTYQIISVFNSRVFYEDEEVFKYYKMDYNLNEKEFNHYIENIKQLSLYDTGITANYGEKLITLSTCSNEIEDGRIVVVAKKIIN